MNASVKKYLRKYSIKTLKDLKEHINEEVDLKVDRINLCLHKRIRELEAELRAEHNYTVLLQTKSR